LDLLGGKWKTVILARLKQSPLRYGELRSVVPGLADKMLTQRLRDLEKAGFVERSKKHDGHVCYQLTSRGRSLGPALEALYEWGSEVAPQVGASFNPALPASSPPAKAIAHRR
jgi:DNA-binding HxlR family transcriptional regulator